MICAHGGNAPGAGAPPNTLPAFRAAISAGFSCVELDVAATMDGHLVVLHVRELDQLLGDRAGLQACRFACCKYWLPSRPPLEGWSGRLASRQCASCMPFADSMRLQQINGFNMGWLRFRRTRNLGTVQLAEFNNHIAACKPSSGMPMQWPVQTAGNHW